MKEMFSLADGDEALCLRPESTASVMRAVLATARDAHLPQRLYYCGPMFRRERPQLGRFREFSQLGIELLGTRGPAADAEAVGIGADFLEALGLLGAVRLHINTIGAPEARRTYADALGVFLQAQGPQRLSEESQRRLAAGHVLRILDSKLPQDAEVLAEAPRLLDFVGEAARARFDAVLAAVRGMSLACEMEVDWRLVRGLDYYGDTVFEFATDRLGAQSTVLAGGRYDGLAQAIGGARQAAVPAIGWAAGLERLVLLRAAVAGREAPSSQPGDDGVPTDVFVVEVRGGPPATCMSSGDALSVACVALCRELRAAGLRTQMQFEGNASRQFARACKEGARLAVVVGDDELARGSVRLKDLRDGRQWDAARADLVHAVRAALAE